MSDSEKKITKWLLNGGGGFEGTPEPPTFTFHGLVYMIDAYAEELESRNALLEKENALLRKVKEAAETVAFSVAGTVGTKTNSELPEWFRLRMADLVKALSACEEGEK